MSTYDRRRFIKGAGAAFALGAMSGAVRAAMGPDDKFDLVIKGGELLDPALKLRGKRDIGIRFAKIEAIEADIPAARANRVLDASGKLVLPGLVDLHSHVYPYGSAIGIPADELIPFQGTTTLVSAGDAGATGNGSTSSSANRSSSAIRSRSRSSRARSASSIGSSPTLTRVSMSRPSQ